MDRFGFIHEKLDIKILILYILNMLPERIGFEDMSALVMVDDGFDYFEYSQCLAELTDTGHIAQDGNFYKITEKGVLHGETVQSSVPFSVRRKAEKNAKPLVDKMKRNALIGTSHKTNGDGGCIVKLSLSDGVGDIFKLSILTDGDEKAKAMEQNFRQNAEHFYLEFIRLLTPENK